MTIPTLTIDRLTTERLLLIPFTTQICRNLLDHDFSDLVTRGYKRGISWPDHDVIDTLPRIIRNLARVEAPTGFESWMIIKKDTLEVIGDAGFKGFNYEEASADIGYGIIREERRKGYAEEAVVALIRWAFLQEVVREITAKCAADNTGSIKLLRKMGFMEEGVEAELIHWSLPRKEL